MHKSFYTSAYNTAVNHLNQPLSDMRQTPEDTILKAVEHARACMSHAHSQHMTEQQCDTMFTELLAAQNAAKATGSGKFSSQSWQWPKKRESEGTYLSTHTVTD